MNQNQCSNLLMYVLIAAVVYMLYQKMNEGFAIYDEVSEKEVNDIVEPLKEKMIDESVVSAPTPSESTGLAPYSGDSQQMDLKEGQGSIPLGKCGTGQFMSSNLLPKDDPKLDDSFAEFAPDLDGKNFVDAYKFVFGSQSQTLRNPNYQLRSDPENPQENVCPWQQSTIYPEKRRELSIGAQ